MTSRKRIQIGLIIGLIIIVIGFAASRFTTVIAGPSVTITSPADGALVTEPTVTISGRAKRINKISLNDRIIFTDDTGNFNETLLLGEGYTILVIKAEDQFGRQVEEKIRLFYKQ